MSSAQDVKVVFDVNSEAWHGHSSESLWASPMNDGFELQNVPFFALGVSLGDVVEGEKDKQGNLRFAGVLRRGGHSTVRVVAPTEDSEKSPFQDSFEKLVAAGCRYESGTVHDLSVFAVDIPPDSDIGVVYRVLEAARESGVWDWELGFDGHPSDPDE